MVPEKKLGDHADISSLNWSFDVKLFCCSLLILAELLNSVLSRKAAVASLMCFPYVLDSLL